MGKIGKKVKNSWMLLASVLVLCGCQPPADATTQLTPSKVVSVGKTHLIVDDGKSVLFVTIEESDKEHLKDLKKGDPITLVSIKSEANQAADDRSIEVVEIITADGAHIPLGG